MSLDVYLYERVTCPKCECRIDTNHRLYDANITHNLGSMAEAAGIYMHLWHPEEIGIDTASQLIEPHLYGACPPWHDANDSRKWWIIRACLRCANEYGLHTSDTRKQLEDACG